MTIEPELLMAYADEALDPLTAKRVERAIAADPSLAEEVARHRRLRARLGAAYAPIADDPVPDQLAAMLKTNVVQMPQRQGHPPRVSAAWRSAAAMAACLVVGVLVGRGVHQEGPVRATDQGLYAAGSLAKALDDQPSGTKGPVRIAVSFRAQDNGFAACSSRPGRTASPAAIPGDGRCDGPCQAAHPAQAAVMSRRGRPMPS